MRHSDDPQYRRLINTRRWMRLRAQVLHQHPLCQSCEAEGYYTAATEVHHVVPVDSVPDALSKERLMYDPGNLVALCHRCHVDKHMALKKGTKAEKRRRVKAEVAGAISKLFGDEDPRGGVIF